MGLFLQNLYRISICDKKLSLKKSRNFPRFCTTPYKFISPLSPYLKLYHPLRPPCFKFRLPQRICRVDAEKRISIGGSANPVSTHSVLVLNFKIFKHAHPLYGACHAAAQKRAAPWLCVYVNGKGWDSLFYSLPLGPDEPWWWSLGK